MTIAAYGYGVGPRNLQILNNETIKATIKVLSGVAIIKSIEVKQNGAIISVCVN